MEDIKRINFFDGLFLQQGEFITEQGYHLHMRRRLNYILFDGSGVVQDLEIKLSGGKTFHVTAGMAISRRDDLREGREVILTDDSPTFDLSTGFGAGDQVFVAINYAESPVDLQTVPSPNMPTRVQEAASVTLHKTWPPTTTLPLGENYILLGQILIALDNTISISPDPSKRQFARIRASLLAPTTATLVSITVTPSSPTITVGSTQAFTATGMYSDGSTKALGPADGVSWASSNTALLTINSTNGLATAVAAGVVNITATIGAKLGTTSATVNSATVPPGIAGLSPSEQISGGSVAIKGTNIRDASLARGAQAIGTAIQLVPGGSTKVVPATDITVDDPIGLLQVVNFRVPDRNGTNWGTKQVVILQLTFGGPTAATIMFQYDD